MKGRCVSDRQKKGRQGGRKDQGMERADNLNFRAQRNFRAGKLPGHIRLGKKEKDKEKLDSCVTAIAVG